MSVEGVLLAAGFSSRAGTHKMMLDISGKTVIERCIEGMYDSCSRIIAVGGFSIENLYPVCRKYPKVKLVFNIDYSQGMFNSIKEGIKHVSADSFFLTPGDYPLIRPDTYQSMTKAGGEIIIPEYNGIKGHPVLLKSTLIDEILNSLYHSSLREFLCTKDITLFHTDDPGILMDLDTASDYKVILQYYKSEYKIQEKHDDYNIDR